MKNPDPNQISWLDTLKENILSVSDAVEVVNGLLQPLTLLIEGEISGYRLNQGKFVFFDLKDESSMVSCFMMYFQLPMNIEDGMRVRVSATPKVRAQTGRMTFTITSLELVGEGALQKAFEELQKKLTTEGLFEQQWKRELPLFPKRIGLVTSKTGEVLHDMMRIFNARAGGLDVVLAPVAVQGQHAVSSIVAAIRYFNAYEPVDLIIVARGGGSAEDLQAFNTEPVVRSIFASSIPIITGVGHEPDTTLVDFVADVRASTPTNAAQLAVPDFEHLLHDLNHVQSVLTRALEVLVTEKRRETDNLLHRMHQSLQAPFRQTDVLKEQLLFQLKQSERKFWHHKSQLTQTSQSFVVIRDKFLDHFSQNLDLFDKSLQQLNPHTVLKRGYALVSDTEGKLVQSITQLKKHAKIQIQLGDGNVESTVESITTRKES